MLTLFLFNRPILCEWRIGCRVGQYACLLVFAHRYVRTLRCVTLHRYVTLHLLLLLLLLIVFAHRLQCRSLCLPSFFSIAQYCVIGASVAGYGNMLTLFSN